MTDFKNEDEETMQEVLLNNDNINKLEIPITMKKSSGTINKISTCTFIWILILGIILLITGGILLFTFIVATSNMNQITSLEKDISYLQTEIKELFDLIKN